MPLGPYRYNSSAIYTVNSPAICNSISRAISLGRVKEEKKRRDLTVQETRAAENLLRIWEIKKGHLTQEQAAFECGWKSQGTVHQYLNGKIPLNFKAVINFSRLLKVDPIEIYPELMRAIPHEEPREHYDQDMPALVAAEQIEEPAVIPILSLSDIEEWDGSGSLHAQGWHSVDFVGHRAFAFYMPGDSMQSPSGLSIPEGALVVVDPEKPAKNNSLVACLIGESGPTFKQLLIDSGRTYLKSLNPRYPLVEVTDKSSLKVFGVAVKAEIIL